MKAYEFDVERALGTAAPINGWTLAHAALVYDMLQKAKNRLRVATYEFNLCRALAPDVDWRGVGRELRALNWWTLRWLLVPERMRLRVARGI